ncbi:MAG TPA: Nif3-like dinuclear metal center hexameric protein [Bacteroidia bacterium]|nr:Nif3-like dinuclear metal center hexameric protein [Bacteroidia bacterium]
MKIKEVLNYLESVCPQAYQESYDNCGLITGDAQQNIKGVLLCLDSTEEVVSEAIKLKCNLIIAHHPILFSPIKKLTGKNYSERTIIKAIKHDICIYAMHTNLDNIFSGVNHKIADKIGLANISILAPKNGLLKKLVTFCPRDKADEVRNAIFSAGSGVIGNYDECSFNSSGIGTFRAGDKANPYVGQKGKRHFEKEERIETIYLAECETAIIKALIDSHPYEEVAYDLYAIQNSHPKIGSGMIGELSKPVKEKDFLIHLKKAMKTDCIRYTPLLGKKIQKVAVCGGSGSFLLPDAIAKGADILVTADFKYHQFFDADNKIVIADIGHYESEQFTPEIIYSLLKERFTTFALLFSKTNTNPINYI